MPSWQKANPGVKLPENEIVVVHRSDGSGTTLRIYRLSLQGQPGMEVQGGREHFGKLAGGLGRQGQ